MKKIPMSTIDQLVVEFENECLKVPDVTVGLKDYPVNSDLLRDYGQLLREGQTSLDRINTHHLPELAPETSEREKELFETLRRLNAEVVLRILVMRNLIRAGLTKR